MSRTARWSSEPVSATMPIVGWVAFRRRVVSMPSIVGIRTSIRTTSGAVMSTSSRAWSPLPAWPTTVISSVSRSEIRESRNPALSSTSSTLTSGRCRRQARQVGGGYHVAHAGSIGTSGRRGYQADNGFARGTPDRRYGPFGLVRLAISRGEPAPAGPTTAMLVPDVPVGCRPSGPRPTWIRLDVEMARDRRRGPHPGTPRARDASAGQGQIGCAISRAACTAAHAAGSQAR